MPGTFTLKPIEAKLTHNTVYYGSMSPYCEFALGDKTVTSTICKKGGKHPHWEDVCTMPTYHTKESILQVNVLDDETVVNNDHIGSFSVDLKEVESVGKVSKWYPIYFNDKLAGEMLLETSVDSTLEAAESKKKVIIPRSPVAEIKTKTIVEQKEIIKPQTKVVIEQKVVEPKITAVIEEKPVVKSHGKTYHEQRQIVEPHTFTKEIDVVETIPVTQKVETMEPIKVMKDVEYTALVRVMKKVEIVEPQVIKKMIEVIEPRVVTKMVQVVENVPVMREVDVIENRTIVKEIESFEPQTFHKQVEVTEYIPVTKEVHVSELIHLKKTIEYVEPITTTRTIIKEILEPVIVGEEITTSVGPATVVDVEKTHAIVDKVTEVKVKETKTELAGASAVVTVQETKSTVIPNVVVSTSQDEIIVSPTKNVVLEDTFVVKKSGSKKNRK